MVLVTILLLYGMYIFVYRIFKNVGVSYYFLVFCYTLMSIVVIYLLLIITGVITNLTLGYGGTGYIKENENKCIKYNITLDNYDTFKKECPRSFCNLETHSLFGKCYLLGIYTMVLLSISILVLVIGILVLWCIVYFIYYSLSKFLKSCNEYELKHKYELVEENIWY